MKSRYLLILSAALCTAATAESDAQHQLRVLPVGDPPPFVQEVRNGVRYEVPPPEGAVPPRIVRIPTTGAGGETNQESADLQMRLRLGQESAPVMLSVPEDGKVEIKSEKGSQWLKFPLKEGGASLALVWRGGSDWKTARSIMMPDGAEARAEGNVHFANLTGAPMAVVIGDEKIKLNPGKTFTRQIARGDGAIPLQILYPSPKGTLSLCHSSTLESTPGNFRRIVIYRADGYKPRMPVKVLQIEEQS